jgi:hypothetical protein
MPARKQRNKRSLHDTFLTKDNCSDTGLDPGDISQGLFGLCDHFLWI